MEQFSKRIRLGIRYSKVALSHKPKFPIQVMNNQDTLDFIIANKASVVRFGDGETAIMCGKGIDYQEYSSDLAARMRAILNTPSSESMVICLPDVFHDLDRYRLPVKLWWEDHLIQYEEFYSEINSEHWYGSSFISRPYMDFKKTRSDMVAGRDFEKLKQIWENQDLLIVEGCFSRSGVGNDLFSGAKTIQRILCPSRNAFSKYENIKSCIEKYGESKLILLMLGPTAKVLAYDLALEGFTAIDIGHIDPEYEWYKMGVKKKVKLQNKHTAEWNSDDDNTIQDIQDEQYKSQTICDLSCI